MFKHTSTLKPVGKKSFGELMEEESGYGDLVMQLCQSMEEKGIRDYHIRLNAKKKGVSSGKVVAFVAWWDSEVGKKKDTLDRSGPCSTCRPDLSLACLLGVEGISNLLDNTPNKALMVYEHPSKKKKKNDDDDDDGVSVGTMRVWIDAKFRPLLVFTPVRHVQRCEEWTTEEKNAFFEAMMTYLKEHVVTKCEKGPRKISSWDCITHIIVNHGACQNHPHLHFKVFLTPAAFEVCKEEMMCKSKETKELMEKIEVEVKKLKNHEKNRKKLDEKKKKKKKDERQQDDM